MPKTVYEFSEEQVRALEWAIEFAWEDQSHYLSFGDPALDYGAEWPEVKQAKADLFDQLAGILAALDAAGLADRCSELARDYREAN